MKALFKYAFAFCIILTLSCSSDDENNSIELFWVDSARVNCTGAFEQLCYLIQNNEIVIDDDWNFLYDSIDGFDSQYEEGFIYRIKVRREFISNPPADASSYIYSLIEIISKEKGPD